MSGALSLAADALVVLVGLIHIFIFHLESLTWYRGSARGFGVSPAHYGATAVFAANQGFYNLALAAALLHATWSANWANQVGGATAVLCCGIIGYVTTGSAKILRAQCVPAGMALAALFLADASDKSGLDRPTLGCVGAAAAATVVLSLFVKARLNSDAAFHAQKTETAAAASAAQAK